MNGGYFGTGTLSMDEFTFFGRNKKSSGMIEFPCLQGKYRTTHLVCSNCIAGRFQDTIDMGGCKTCSPGRYGNTTGLTSCARCLAGRYGNTTGLTSNECTGPCPVGRYGNTTGLTSNECTGPCPVGRYGVGGSTTNECSGVCLAASTPGTSYCSSCPAGQYESSSICHECEAGRFSLPGAIECTKCAAGRYSFKGQGKSADCNGICPAGKYESSNVCHECEAGRFSLPGAIECTKCAAGRYSFKGQGKSADCNGICPAGKYESSNVCHECEAGRFSLPGAIECTKCAAGRYSFKGQGKSADCNGICPIGSFARQGEGKNESCLLCPSGRYGDSVGLTAAMCSGPCSAGRFGIQGNTGPQCEDQCPLLTYSLEGTNCISCPPGKISQPNSKSEDACITFCPLGQFFNNVTLTCKECPPGRFSPYIGLEGVSELNLCSICPQGRYNSEAGQTSCHLCAAGKYNDKNGQIACNSRCRVGTYSREGSTQCQKCPGGYKGTHPAAISLEDGCLKCEQGKFSNDTGGHQRCTECHTPGTYCPPGAIKPELCSIDKFCDGQTIRDRPPRPTDIVLQNIPDTNAINVSWKMEVDDTDVVEGTFRVLYTTKKDTPLVDMDQIIVDDKKRLRQLSISEKLYYTEIEDLRVGTQYFIRVLRVEKEGESPPTESQPSELSDKAEIKCPDGAYCGSPGGRGVQLNETVNLQGYFKVNDFTFVKCEVSTNCPGVITDDSGEAIPQNNTQVGCSDGYRGLMCMKCEQNYTRQGDLCNQCGSKSIQVLWMVGALFVGVCMFSYLIYKTIKGEGNPKDVQSGVLKIALRQFQLIGIISQFPLSWSDSIKQMFGAFGTVSNAGSQAFSLDCFTKASYATNSALNLSMPIGILMLFWFMISRIYQGNREARTRNLKLSTIVILMTLHPTLVKQVLAFFQCTKPVMDKTYLIADVDVQCRSSTHLALVFMLGIPALVLYIIGIPAVAGMNLYTNRHNLGLTETRKTFGFLYSNYEEKYYFWELVIILRLVAMASISVLFDGNPNMQATLGSQVLFLAMFLHMVCRPFEEDILDTVETYSLASSVLSLTCGNLLLNDTTPDVWKSFATVLIFLSMAAFTFYCIGISVYAITNQEEIATRRVLRHRGQTVDKMSRLDPYPIMKSLMTLVRKEWKWEYIVETDEYAISRLRPGAIEKSLLSKKKNTSYDARKIEFVVPMPLMNVWENFITRNVDHTYFPKESNSSSEFAYMIINAPVPFISSRLLVFEEEVELFDNEGIAISAASTTRQAATLAVSQKTKDQVLMSMPIGGHVFERLDSENTKVTHLFSVDIGGSIPIQISNIVARREITKGHTVVKEMLQKGEKTYFDRKYFTVHASPIRGRSTSRFTSKRSAGSDIEMVSNPMTSTVVSKTSSSKKGKQTKIVMNTNPMTIDSKKFLNVKTRERSSTDLVIGTEIENKWVNYIDSKTGKPYFKKNTNETTWVNPKGNGHNSIEMVSNPMKTNVNISSHLKKENHNTIAMKKNPMMNSSKSVHNTGSQKRKALIKKRFTGSIASHTTIKSKGQERTRANVSNEGANSNNEDWTEHKDPKTGKQFWYNTKTKKSTWTNPNPPNRHGRALSEWT
eukprot:g3899.t1